MLAEVTGYQIGQFIHVLAAVMAFGPTFGYAIFQGLAESRFPRAVPAVLRAMLISDRFLVTPAMIVVLLAGLYMVSEGKISMGESWVSVGLTATVVLFAMVHGFFDPRARKGIELAERDLAAGGELSEEYMRAVSRPANIGGSSPA